MAKFFCHSEVAYPSVVYISFCETFLSFDIFAVTGQAAFCLLLIIVLFVWCRATSKHVYPVEGSFQNCKSSPKAGKSPQ